MFKFVEIRTFSIEKTSFAWYLMEMAAQGDNRHKNENQTSLP